MSKQFQYPRFANRQLSLALEDSPVVLIHGPRQCGKTTFARSEGEGRGYHYRSFDNHAILEAAKADPIGFVADLPDKVILDECQRVPELFSTIKIAVDEGRRPGRFILTGSTNILLLPTLSDSLAGRMEVIRLHPLAQSEIRAKRSGFLESAFAGKFPSLSAERMGEKLIEIVQKGGFPEAIRRGAGQRSLRWLNEYVTALINRDVQDQAQIHSLDVLPQLMRVAAQQTGTLFNLASIASAFEITRQTIRRYLGLLRRVFLLTELPAWHRNNLKRLVKRPKLHLGDSGVAAALLNANPNTLMGNRQLYGQLLETFVYQELRREASWSKQDIQFSHYRDRDGYEVDIVMERGPFEVVGIEVKAGATVRSSDFYSLKRLQKAAGDAFRCGVVLYDGGQTLSFGDGLYAVPVQQLWSLDG